VPAQAAVFPLPPPGSDLVGEVITVRARAEDTLLDIARRHDLGYNEIIAANPGVDPWLPEPGREIVVPARFVLPSAPREGIVINLAEMRLYYFPPPQRDGAGVVMTFPIGIGREGWGTPLGKTRIVEKKRDPAWVVPESIRRERAAQGDPLPPVVPPGPDNPLGRFALRLGMPGYLIHGTNKPFGVGRRISHGCIRMYPEDIEVLFEEVEPGTPVRIVDQPYKLGREGNALYLEAHEPIGDHGAPVASNLPQVMGALAAVVGSAQREAVLMAAMTTASLHSGVPRRITTLAQGREASGAGWMLQVGAFSSGANAERMAGTIRAVAHLEVPVAVEARVDDGFCHVLVGPFDRRETALRAKTRLAAEQGIEAHVFPADRHGLVSACLP